MTSVFNKMVGENQLTILIHVDDLDQSGIDDVIAVLNTEYAKANV